MLEDGVNSFNLMLASSTTQWMSESQATHLYLTYGSKSQNTWHISRPVPISPCWMPCQLRSDRPSQLDEVDMIHLLVAIYEMLVHDCQIQKVSNKSQLIGQLWIVPAQNVDK